MLFNSLVFVAFFAVVYPLYRLLPFRPQQALLLVASWVFYGWWDPRFLALLVGTSTVDWAIGLAIAGAATPRARRRWLLISVVTNLGVLGLFKYFGFFAGEAVAALEALGLGPAAVRLPEIVLPVGLSFYTFQSMAYTIDVYRGDVPAERSWARFALFVAFFPQLVAGPIERAKDLLPQLSAPRRVDPTAMAEGTFLILWGYFKKLFVADNAAALVAQAFDAPSPSFGLVLVGVYAFTFQIYGDFSGYSDIARGVAKWLGVELTVNFRAPLFATGPQDLWRRWHVSLGRWLRDYLYVPLGGSRLGPARTGLNLMVTMLLGGLWHGANWTFLAWGAWHGAGLALERAARALLPALRMPRPVATLLTFHFTVLGFLLFRAESFGHAGRLLSTLAHPVAFGQPEHVAGRQLLVLVAPLLLAEAVGVWRGDPGWLLRLPRPVQALAAAALFLATVFLGASFHVRFIYFQF